MAKEHARVCGFNDRIEFRCADLLAEVPEAADAAFVDPGRRTGDRRLLDPEHYLPPLNRIVGHFKPGHPLAAKIAPGVARSHLTRYDTEAEFISADGELKECVLWFGPLRTANRRATVLPGPHTLASDNPLPLQRPEEPCEFLFDPDPAVIRAELLSLLAEQLDAAPVDPGVAFLTGRRAVRSPFADCYHVDHAAAFHQARLRDYLREQRVGRITILKRAVDLDINDVERKLKLEGSEHRHLILTRSMGRFVAIVAEKC
jgi:hypothetical protein